MADEVKTITIDDKKYDMESLTEKSKSIIANLQRVDQLLTQQQFEVSISQLGRAKLLEELAKEVPNFKEVTE